MLIGNNYSMQLISSLQFSSFCLHIVEMRHIVAESSSDSFKLWIEQGKNT